jgi:photosystem II stability/assembly factor-like uncharacterized protein
MHAGKRTIRAPYATPLRHALAALALLFTVGAQAHAQWELEESHSTASLRGIDNVGNGVAWASGSNGTVLRTEDGGYLWQPCTTPPGAEKLDFRGVQALDQNTALVMSSGPGDQSRLYKTTDGCQTWKLVFANPDAKGFFDSLRRVTAKQLYLLGDPVDGKFSVFYSPDAGNTWYIADDPGLDADKDAGAFAASNTSLIAAGPFLYFGTGGAQSPHLYTTFSTCDAAKSSCPVAWTKTDLPLATGSAAAGIFSLASRNRASMSGKITITLVAVGGTYDHPDDAQKTAATSTDNGHTWTPAQTPPHGYRSAVAFDSNAQTWITVGPNGTDLSTDDGRTWTPLHPSAAEHDAPDADKNWNALSLPFVVGPHGRIGKLRGDALPEPAKASR